MLFNDLNAIRKGLAILQADIVVASQGNNCSTSPTQDTGITPAEALAARLRASLRDTNTELISLTKAHEDLKKTVADLQAFKNGLDCTKDWDCTSCPMHMRQAFRVARANEAEANDIVDKIQHELFQTSSELQDCKHAMKEKFTMLVDAEISTPQSLSSPATSIIVGSGGESEVDNDDSDNDSVDICTGPILLGAVKIRKGKRKEERGEEGRGSGCSTGRTN